METMSGLPRSLYHTTGMVPVPPHGSAEGEQNKYPVGKCNGGGTNIEQMLRQHCDGVVSGSGLCMKYNSLVTTASKGRSTVMRRTDASHMGAQTLRKYSRTTS